MKSGATTVRDIVESEISDLPRKTTMRSYHTAKKPSPSKEITPIYLSNKTINEINY